MSDTVNRVVTGLFVTHVDENGVVRTAHRGESVSLTKAEADRIDPLGTVADLGSVEDGARARQAALDRYRAERGDADAVAAVARAVAPTESIPDVSQPQAHVSSPPLGGAPVGSVVTGDTGAPDVEAPAAPAGGNLQIVRADAPDVASASVGEIASWISEESPNVTDTVGLAEGQPDFAAKVLEAERAATGGDPRKGVEDALSKIADTE